MITIMAMMDCRPADSPIRERFGKQQFRLWISLFSLIVFGCQESERLGVSGRVTRTDGAPVVGAKLTFRAPETGNTAIGFTDGDGQYELGTTEVGQGVLPGTYRIAISEDRGSRENPRPRTIHYKYERPEGSGLQFTVEPGGPNTYDIVVEPAP